MNRSFAVLLIVVTGLKFFYGDITSSQGQILLDVNADGHAEAHLNSTGLGIGTTPGSARLEVSGNAIVSGKMVIGGESVSGSNLQVNGTFAIQPQTCSSDQMLGDSSMVLANSASDNIILALPTASSHAGKQIHIKKISENNHVVLLGSNAPQSPVTLSASSMGAVLCFSDGSQWFTQLGMGTWDISKPVAYYRFTSGSEVVDSSGCDNHLSAVNSTTVIAIPGAGDGSDFPTTLPQSGLSNSDILSFTEASDIAGFSAPDSISLDRIAANGALTLEAYINMGSTGRGTPEDARYIVSQYDTTGNQRSYAWQINGDEGMSLFLSSDGTSTGGNVFTIPSASSIIAGNKDYYVAVSYDTTTTTITYYWQNLTDSGTLQSETKFGGPTSLFDTTTDLTIGYRTDSTKRWGDEGVIDEVRVSPRVLAVSELLTSN